MEKYIVLLIVFALMLAVLFTLPVFGLEPENTYVVSPRAYGEVFPKSEKWQADGFYVYRLDENEINKADLIPGGKVIREYYTAKSNSIYKGNVLMQTYISGNVRIYGCPYIID